MENKRSKGKIYPIKWSPISHKTNFSSFSFKSYNHILEYRRKHPEVIQIKFITLTPVVDSSGNLFNPDSPVVLFLN